ncbi:hypothetical protein D3C71_1269430 [compost metagenome]
MQNPDGLLRITGDERLYPNSLRVQVRAAPEQTLADVFRGVVVKVLDANDLQRLVLDTNDQMATRHVGNGGDIAGNVLAFAP